MLGPKPPGSLGRGDEMRKLNIEHEAEHYAEERHINAEKREAFISGAVWLARKFARMEDPGPMVEAMASDSIKNYLDELTIKDIRSALYELLTYPAPTPTEPEDRS